MKQVLLGAFFLASAFGQQATAHSTVGEQNYISSISAFKKGLKIPDHLKDKSILNSDQWATLRNPPEIKVDHQEAAVKPTLAPETKPAEVKPVETETTKPAQKLGGQLLIQKTNENSKSQKTVEIPAVALTKEQTTEKAHNHDWNKESDVVKGQSNLRREEAEQKKQEKQNQVVQEQQFGKGLIVPEPVPSPAPQPVEEPVPKPVQVPVEEPKADSLYGLSPHEEPALVVAEPPQVVSQPAPPVEENPVSAEGLQAVDSVPQVLVGATQVSGNQIASQADNILESTHEEQVFSEQYPTLGELKVGVEV